MVFIDNGFALDLSRSGIERSDIDDLSRQTGTAHEEMIALENGAIKNIDEQRQVTHFTDRLHYGGTDLFNDVDAFFDSNNADTIKSIAEIVYMNGRFREACNYFTQYLTLRPMSTESYTNLAIAYIGDENLSAAEVIAKQGVRRLPEK